MEVGRRMVARLTDTRHRQQRQHMRHVVFSHNDRGREPQGDTVSIGNLILLAVCHLDDKWDPFADRSLELVSSHINLTTTLPRCLVRRKRNLCTPSPNELSHAELRHGDLLLPVGHRPS
jgi:hypothetical protein